MVSSRQKLSRSSSKNIKMTVEECAAMFDAVSMREAFWFRFALVPRTCFYV
ncbi:hypothetical protein Plhal304r1_c028g0093591 [Plasmopara halstedii]